MTSITRRQSTKARVAILGALAVAGLLLYRLNAADSSASAEVPAMAAMSGMAPMPGMVPMPGMPDSRSSALPPPAGNPPPLSEEVSLGAGLYILHCAGCHGSKLEGQPNWSVPLPDGRLLAPPLNASGHARMHGDSDLLAAVKNGPSALYPGTPIDMPAFEGVLTDDDIRAVIAFIKTSW